MITSMEFVTEAKTLAATNLTIPLIWTSSIVQLSRRYCISQDGSTYGFRYKTLNLVHPLFIWHISP
jgi:hypothetical protein